MADPHDLHPGDILSHLATFSHGDIRVTVQGVYIGPSPHFAGMVDARWFRLAPLKRAEVEGWREPVPAERCRKLRGVDSVRNQHVRTAIEEERSLVLEGKVELSQRRQVTSPPTEPPHMNTEGDAQIRRASQRIKESD